MRVSAAIPGNIMKRDFRRCAIAALFAFSAALPAGAATSAQPPRALQSDSVRDVEQRLDAARDIAAERLIAIGGIVSPSGEEAARADAVAAIMRDIGLKDVAVTEATNAVGRIPGRSGRAVVFVSTLDDLKTVAEHQRARGKPPARRGTRIEGPGTNTSSTTVAMLTAAEALIDAGFSPEHDLVFAAVAQEETGLVGMRALYEETKDDAVAYIDILGDGRRISYGALGIHWWKITAEGPPGHTLRGGLPNVNRGIARAVDRILGLPHPEEFGDRMTRANVAILRSGAVFNHKPEDGWFSLDLRSLDADVIASMEEGTRAILKEVSEETQISFRMEPENLVPGGQIAGALDSDLVRWSIAIAEHMGFDPALSNAGSANLNIAIAGGSPAIGLGGERGGRRGFPDEWADLDAMMRTSRHAALLALTLGAGQPYSTGAHSVNE